MKIYLASSNEHKKQEILQCLQDHEIVMPIDVGLDFSPKEDGNSFLQNAMIKAKALYQKVKTPVLADDSGLCVKALGDRPGVFSARYSTPPMSQKNVADYGISRLLKEMEEIEDRRAVFVCCIVLYIEEHSFFVFQDVCKGKIEYKKKGSNGFGYDPIFFVDSMAKTMAELTEKEKNLVSHRGKALVHCRAFLKNLENSNCKI